MTCKSLYCESSRACADTRCPGHPGAHCLDLRPVKKGGKSKGLVDSALDDYLTTLGRTAVGVIVSICWVLLIITMSR